MPVARHRAGLNADDVVKAAAEIADETSFANLTLGLVAGRLGVRAPSLYKHVDGLADLRHRVATLAMKEFGDIARGAAAGLAGRDALAALAHALRDYVTAHPGRYTATVGAEFTGKDDPLLEASTRVIELIGAVLRGYRIDEDTTVHAIRSVRCTLHGWATLQAASGFQWSGDLDTSFEALIDYMDSGLRGLSGRARLSRYETAGRIMEFAEIVVETDRLAFPALAAGDGPPVVCWHGFPDHPATFWPMAEHLVAAGRRVIAPFLRGLHPATAAAATYTDGLTLAADAAAVAAAVVAMTGSPDGVDMIGHDIGAGMVQRVAAAWPQHLRRGVTMAVPPPVTLARMFADPAQLRRSFYIWLFHLDGLPEAIMERDRRLIDYLWDTWSPGLGEVPHRELVRALYGDAQFIRNALRIYRANFDTALHDPALSGLAQTTETTASMPLMLLGGADDGCIDQRFLREASGLAAGSRIEIIPNAGHFLHLERPDAVARLALQWFGPSGHSDPS